MKLCTDKDSLPPMMVRKHGMILADVVYPNKNAKRARSPQQDDGDNSDLGDEDNAGGAHAVVNAVQVCW